MTNHVARRVLGIIPARYGSTRLPGKPLECIGGKPMLQHTFEAASRSKRLSEVVIATDDSRIQRVARNFGATTFMTGRYCKSGTDRIVELLQSNDELRADIIVNIQGDEPFINPMHIDEAISALEEGMGKKSSGNNTGKRIVMSTIATRIRCSSDFQNPNVVKVVTDKSGGALYFSRSPIPYSSEDVPTNAQRHIGLYAYDAQFIQNEFKSLPNSILENNEDLEQLRVLEAGLGIVVRQVGSVIHGIDTQDQLEAARAFVAKISKAT